MTNHPNRSKSPSRVLAARRYLGAIRNPAKRAYGVQYLAYLRGAALEPERGELSYMAAQAVRMSLHEIWDKAA